MNKFIVLFLIFSQFAWAGLPPPSTTTQGGTTLQAKFNHQAPEQQITDLGGIKALIETGNQNVLSNPSFEASSFNQAWANATISPAGESVTIRGGKVSAKMAASSNQGELYQDRSPVGQTNGQPMVAACWVNTTLTDVQVCARTNATDISCSTVASAGNWVLQPVNFTGPSNGTSVGVGVKNTSNETGNFYVDDCYVGVASTPQNFGQVSQASLVGTVKITGSAAAFDWGNAVTSYTNSPTQTGTVYAATGNLSAPSTNIAGFKMSGGPGEYMIVYTGWMGGGNGSAGAVYFRMSDGTNVSLDEAQWQVATGTNNPLTGGAVWHMTETTAFSNLTFQVQAKEATAADPVMGGSNSNPGVFTVYRFPTSSEIAYRPDVLPASWSGTQVGVGGGWSTTSASYVDPSVATTSNTLTQLTAQGITCSAEATKLPGITCTLTKPGIHKVCASLSLSNSTDGAGSLARLVDGSGTVINGGVDSSPSGASGTQGVTLCGNYSAASITSAITFKVQLFAGSNTTSINQNSITPITWTVDAISASMPAPLLMGSVTSTSTGQEHIERALVTCNGSTCSVTSQSGSWLSVARSGTGGATMTFTAGEWSAAPSCIETAQSSGTIYCDVGGAGITTGGYTSSCVTSTGNTGADSAFHVICQGPR